MPKFDFGSLIEKKESPQEEILPEEPKIISKPIEITEKESYNKSLELNLIKCLYANRFGSTTNKLKSDMQKAIINKWKKY